MTMSEPTFAVPLSKLYQLNPIADWAGGGFSADCLLLGEHEFQNIPGAGFRSQAEAESAAIEHLADVHSIVPISHESPKSWVKTEEPYVPDGDINDEPEQPRWELMHDEF